MSKFFIPLSLLFLFPGLFCASNRDLPVPFCDKIDQRAAKLMRFGLSNPQGGSELRKEGDSILCAVLLGKREWCVARYICNGREAGVITYNWESEVVDVEGNVTKNNGQKRRSFAQSKVFSGLQNLYFREKGREDSAR